jgi:hypothetical protein
LNKPALMLPAPTSTWRDTSAGTMSAELPRIKSRTMPSSAKNLFSVAM